MKPITLLVSLTERWLVGSSRISTFDLKCMARAMATPCRWPPESSPTSASGERRCRSTSAIAWTLSSRMRFWSSMPKPPIAKLQRLAADEQVAGDRHGRDHGIVLVDRLDAEVHRVARACGCATGLPSIRISPSSGSVDAGQDLDQRRLAGAVVADQADRLAAADVEADALQRVDARIPFMQVADSMIGVGHAQVSTLIAGALAQPGIGDDGEDGQEADGELEPVGVDLAEHQAVVDDADQERADDARRSTVPMPPASDVPPITAAATACSSSPSPIEGSGEPSRSTWISAGEAGQHRAEHEADDLHAR